MMAAYNVHADAFEVRSVRQEAAIRLADTGVLANLDLSMDGKQLIYLSPAATEENQQTANHATFISDFFGVISRRVP